MIREPRPEAHGAESSTDSADLRRWRVVLAWIVLVIADILMKCMSFNRFYQVVARWPTMGRTPERDRATRSREICETVNRARAFYIRRAWCLQSAVAAVFLLRASGIRCNLVIGVRKLPFYAHAWVDVDGDVVLNDRVGLSDIYQEITRC